MSDSGLSSVDRGRGDKKLFGEWLLRHVTLEAPSQYFKADRDCKHSEAIHSARHLQLIERIPSQPAQTCPTCWQHVCKEYEA